MFKSEQTSEHISPLIVAFYHVQDTSDCPARSPGFSLLGCLGARASRCCCSKCGRMPDKQIAVPDRGQPNMVRPAVAADLYRMSALVVRAIDQKAANGHLAHFPQGDFLITSH